MFGDPGNGEKGDPQNQRQQDNLHPHEKEVERGVTFMGGEDDRADGPGAGKQGHGDGNNRHRFPVTVAGLFLAEGDRTLPGMEHGYCHEQDQDSAADPEGTDTDTKKAEQKFTRQQGSEQDHQDGNHRDLGGPLKFLFRGICGQGHDNGNCPDGIDNGQQGNKNLGIFRKIEHGFHSPVE